MARYTQLRNTRLHSLHRSLLEAVKKLPKSGFWRRCGSSLASHVSALADHEVPTPKGRREMVEWLFTPTAVKRARALTFRPKKRTTHVNGTWAPGDITWDMWAQSSMAQGDVVTVLRFSYGADSQKEWETVVGVTRYPAVRPMVVFLEVRLGELPTRPHEAAWKALEKLPGSSYRKLLAIGPTCGGGKRMEL